MKEEMDQTLREFTDTMLMDELEPTVVEEQDDTFMEQPEDLTVNLGGNVQKKSQSSQTGNLTITIWEKDSAPQVVNVRAARNAAYYFGRDMSNQIVLKSKVVSHTHGRIIFRKNQWFIEDKEAYESESSTNGLLYDGKKMVSQSVCDGSVIRIDSKIEKVKEGVLFLFSNQNSSSKWVGEEIGQKREIRIGRQSDNDIVLPHISVSRHHAVIRKENDGWYLVDCKSLNGIIVNNEMIQERQKLQERDIITIANAKLIFTSTRIFYCSLQNGISVDVDDVVIKRKQGLFKKPSITGNHINLNIQPGELVAIIGGSGAGKSTILNSMCGYLKPASGSVSINGVDLYKNFNSLKNLIGYVPQSDIVYDNLTLRDMLQYTARLRLPADTSAAEREKAIDRAIRLVDLTEKRDSLIRSLSGGQKKRASIAVELLSDPNLLFLDEPASGLDPGTERSLMTSLRKMADDGKTIILVTHSTLQLALCDKIVFMGKGGNLCYFGSLQDALSFFEVKDVVDIYKMITDDALKWKGRYQSSVKSAESSPAPDSQKVKSRKKRKSFQLPILSGRYLKLIFNDKQRLGLLFLQPLILALMIFIVANDQEFVQFEKTQNILFVLSCAGFWIGMMNSIQEICKERTITKREYMTGLSLKDYVLSKMLILGFLSFLQSVLLVGVFTLTIGLPEEGVRFLPIIEIMITTFMTTLAATGMGLCVSAFFKNPDRAMTMVPLLLMPQILFSGLIFELDGITKKISWFAICRWSMEGYGTTANLNELPLRLQQEGINIVHNANDFYEYTDTHIFQVWGLLFLFVILYLILARVVLITIGKENG